MEWRPLSGLVGLPPPLGGLLFNQQGSLGSIGFNPSSFSIGSGLFDFSSSAVCFNLGPWSGDLIGGACSSPTLAPGAASRSVGALGGALTGSLPNPTLSPLAVVTALGAPSGDLGGTSWSAALVTGLRGFPICSTPPSPNSSLVWNGSQYCQAVIAPGINQTTGDVLTGPGTGSQPSLIAAGAVTNQKLSPAQAQTVKCNAGVASSTPQDCAVTGGLVFNNGALQLDPALGTSQAITVGSNCWTLSRGVVQAITPGACSTGVTLTADDGVTALWADDGATALTADGGSALTPCASNLVLKFNILPACNAITRAAM